MFFIHYIPCEQNFLEDRQDLQVWRYLEGLYNGMQIFGASCPFFTGGKIRTVVLSTAGKLVPWMAGSSGQTTPWEARDAQGQV